MCSQDGIAETLTKNICHLSFFVSKPSAEAEFAQ